MTINARHNGTRRREPPGGAPALPPGQGRADAVARPAPGAERSVAVLELLAAHPDDRFTLSEVARRCDLNKATAHALLSTLSERGVLLRHPEEKRYSLGPVLVSIGEAARRGYSAVDFVRPTLHALARDTGLWARAWVVEGDHISVVADAGRPPGLSAGQAGAPAPRAADRRPRHGVRGRGHRRGLARPRPGGRGCGGGRRRPPRDPPPRLRGDAGDPRVADADRVDPPAGRRRGRRDRRRCGPSSPPPPISRSC